MIDMIGARKTRYWLSAAALITAATVLLASPLARAWPATLIHVSDGDTISVRRTATGHYYRVRIFGIDAPETHHGANKPGQNFGPRAKAYMQKLVRGKKLDVKPTGETSYDRIVARVSANGRDVARAMVQAGLAWDYRHYDPHHQYTKAETIARQHRRGLWAQPTPTPPWQWRHRVWNHTRARHKPAASNGKTLTARQAAKAIGHTVTVCARATQVYYAQSTHGQPTFINLDKRYPNAPLTLIIWGDHRDLFSPPPEHWQEHQLCAHGKIKSYRGRAEIILRSPRQVTLKQH